MENNFNFSEKQLNNLMNMAKKKTGINIDEMKESAQQGNLNDFVEKNMDSKTIEKLKSVLSDKNAAQQILNSPQAQELMKKLKEGK